MLQSIKQLYGKKLGASDGEIGHVKDFYFDDQNWVVRYVIADTGNWLPGRRVLISPHAFGGIHQSGDSLLVNLTRKQIENCPLIEAHKPVSRQYEEEYYRYYGWPTYWQGEGLWGSFGDFPVLGAPPGVSPGSKVAAAGPKTVRADVHLRSTQAVKGYSLHASDGIIGHVCDFMMDDLKWVIGELVIKTGNRFTGKEVPLPVANVDRISYEESMVYVNLTREVIEQGPAHLPPSSAVKAAPPLVTTI
jgi:hypothetical protein